MVSCILRHRGVHLKLAYSWARPAILIAGKGRGGMFLFLLFLHFHSCSYFFPNRRFHLLYISSISFLPFSGRRHKMTHKGWRVVKPQHNQNNHTHLLFSANQITSSRLFIEIHILNVKQCRSRSVGFWRSQLIWIYTVCKGRYIWVQQD